jgi:hypothetical protein
VSGRVSDRDLALRAARESARGGHRPTGVLPERITPPAGGTAAIGPAAPSPSEVCPGCGAPIALDDAWCRTCGSSRGISTATPRETYLRACVAGLELLRQSHRQVRPLAETRRAETDLERAIEMLRGGVGL